MAVNFFHITHACHVLNLCMHNGLNFFLLLKKKKFNFYGHIHKFWNHKEDFIKKIVKNQKKSIEDMSTHWNLTYELLNLNESMDTKIYCAHLFPIMCHKLIYDYKVKKYFSIIQVIINL